MGAGDATIPHVDSVTHTQAHPPSQQRTHTQPAQTRRHAHTHLNDFEVVVVSGDINIDVERLEEGPKGFEQVGISAASPRGENGLVANDYGPVDEIFVGREGCVEMFPVERRDVVIGESRGQHVRVHKDEPDAHFRTSKELAAACQREYTATPTHAGREARTHVHTQEGRREARTDAGRE
eukprot:GHVU01102582.1.p3 GENE.GHVU01102582.1~~GHVU01102582.1.p3  ORF type:complete len:180 (+),score=21.73 GHVU01102582.1:201-740(+)